jgi:hypothetical protein
MKRIIVSALDLVLLLGLGAGIALPAKDASAQQTQGQMPMKDASAQQTQGQMPMKDASAQQTQGQMPMTGQGQMPMMGHGMMPMMGQGQMPMMGHGMMRQGMGGQGKMAPGMGPWVVPIKHLSTDEVRHFLEHRLDGQGYKRLKVGSVEEKDNGTISAEIVSVEGSLVQRLEVDRHTGLIMQVE